MTTKKCPKCGSRYFQVYDSCIMVINYIVEGGRVIANGRCDDGDHVSTTCKCDECGHTWYPKRLGEDFIIDE